jgi:hypothetical protein
MEAVEVRVGRIGWIVGWIAVVVSCGHDDGMRGEAVEDDDGIDVVRLGVLEFYGESDDDVIVLPEIIVAGEPFTLRINTYNGLCDEPEATDVEYGDGQVVVSPYVHTLIPRGTVCPDALKRVEHRAEIVLPSAGESAIVIRGRRVAATVDEEITREIRVVAE